MVQEGGQDLQGISHHGLLISYSILSALKIPSSKRFLMEAMIQQMQFGFPFRADYRKNLTLSVEGEGRVSWISRIRTDKLYKLETKKDNK